MGWIEFDFAKAIYLRKISMLMSSSSAQVAESILQGSQEGSIEEPETAEWTNIDVHSWKRTSKLWKTKRAKVEDPVEWIEYDIENPDCFFRYFRIQIVSNHGDSVCSG